MSGEAIANETLRKLHRIAERLTRTSEEADDLVQDALLAALEQKRDWTDSRFFAWSSGVIRRRAMFLARTAGRRRRRDTAYATETSAPPPAQPNAKLPIQFIDSLPRSLQTIAFLANAGLGREEIAHLLGISDGALRKRISELRRAWKDSGADADLSQAGPQHGPPCGLLRRSLRSRLLKLRDASFAMTDPDGHEIFLGSAHKSLTHGN